MDFKVDFYDLGKCWVEQVDMVFEYGEKLVELELQKNTKKDKLEELKAEIDLDIRSNSDKKPTEAAILSMIITNPNYQEQLSSLYELDKEYRKVKNICNVLETRRKALDGLTQLYAAGYFSSKNIEIPEEIKTKTQEEQHAQLKDGNTKRRLKRAMV